MPIDFFDCVADRGRDCQRSGFALAQHHSWILDFSSISVNWICSEIANPELRAKAAGSSSDGDPIWTPGAYDYRGDRFSDRFQ